MNSEFFIAIEQIEKEKGIPKSYMLEKISHALVTAYKTEHKKDAAAIADNVVVEVNEAKKDMRMYVHKEVVEQVENPAVQITADAAVKYSTNPQIGDIVSIEIAASEFTRIAAQTAKQVIIQAIREAERGMIFEAFTSKEHEILTGTVLRIERNGNITVNIGNSETEKTEATLSSGEQIPGETYVEGRLIKVYVVEVKKSSRGVQILVSRTHPGLVKRLFELEVPEIADGTVEIMSISREAGSRTKMAVKSTDSDVDPVGACVGPRGGRVSAVVDELQGEKIDIIKYSDDPAEYIATALSPADVVKVTLLTEGRSCRVNVPDDQLSLAIGKEGQNARLAARLTGYKIDIKSQSQGWE